jgi:hypothetical protein
VSRTSGTASSTAIARVFAGALFVDVPITITNAATNCP